MRVCAYVVAVLAAVVMSMTAGAQTPTVYVYQGRLTDSGQPMNGTAELSFQLFDAQVGGSSAGSISNYSGVPISDGLFTVNLNMGAEVFNDDERWLQITVNGTVLSPRQLIGYAPRALQVRGIDRDDATGFLGIGTGTPVSPLEVRGDGVISLTASNETGLPAARFTSDSILYTLEANIEVPGAAAGFFRSRNGGRAVSAYAYDGSARAIEAITFDPTSWAGYFQGRGYFSDRVGIGTESPLAELHVEGTGGTGILSRNPSPFAFAIEAIADGDSSVGVYGSTAGNSGIGVWGRANSVSGVGVEGEALATGGGVGVVARASGQNSIAFSALATGSGTVAGQFSGGHVWMDDRLSVGTTTRQNRLYVTDVQNSTATPTHHVAMFENTSTGASPDVLALMTRSTDLTPGAGVNYITFFDSAENSLGSIQGNGAGGVEFAGPGNDYAEWLEQSRAGESFLPGDVVAVRGGKISLDTTNATSLMVISTTPIVTGNRPFEDEEGGITGWHKVAFIGQAPVNVVGSVSTGDFLVPSGLHDGSAIAVAPDAIEADQLTRVIGIAWGESNEPGLKQVNAAIGVDQSNANAHVIRAQRDRLDRLTERLERLEEAVSGSAGLN